MLIYTNVLTILTALTLMGHLFVTVNKDIIQWTTNVSMLTSVPITN